MSQKTIKQLNAEAKSLLVEAKAIYDKGDDATPEDLAAAATKATAAQKIVEDLDKLGTGEALKTINRIENSLAVFDQVKRPSIGGDGVGTGRDGRAVEAKTAGETFVSDDRFTSWLKSVAPEGHLPERGRISSPAIAVKTLYTSAADRLAGGPLLGQADRRAEVVTLGWVPNTVQQIVTNLPTSSDLVEVVRELARTNNAAAVSEATATGGASGLKPESAITWEVINAAVQTIAHWIPATTRILADAARLRGEIDSFLRQGIDAKLEDLLLNGSGVAPNFAGINNTTGILAQAYDATGKPLFTTTRKAKTKAMVAGLAMPTAYLFNPYDWEALDLLQDGEDRYYFGGPTVTGVPRIWGLPVVESQYQAQGAGLVGDFRDAVIYDREQTTITVGNQHADFFIRNMVAILAEMRAAFHVRRPRSFCSIDLTAA